MKKGLRGKFQNKKGFTLVEMLIVVAIIAILIAVSIPLVSSALEKARDATDQANERAAKALAVIEYLGIKDGSMGAGIDAEKTYYYDAPNGKLIPDTKPTGDDAIVPYGQCTAKGDHTDYNKDGETHVNKIIKVVLATDGEVTISWE